ncbi:MAG: hypothetical protein GWN53_17225 [Gammaproteobacteria bacterium]|nr:hypothetical protein [Gammaproteobacteria bacterium]
MLPSVEKYVPRRSIGEAEESYDERKALVHVSGLLGSVIDALVGLWARKPPEEDEWGSLGERGEDGELNPDSVAQMIVEDADRSRTTWDNHRRARATWTLVYRKVFTYIDTNKPPQDPDADEDMDREEARQANIRPFVTLVSPLDVIDWIEKDGRKVEVVIREEADNRDSLDDGSADVEERFLRLRLNGWERFRVVKEGENVRVERIGGNSYAYEDSDGTPRLPLVEATLPLPRYISYNLARIVLAIINHDSHLDSLDRAGALAQFLAVQGDSEEIKKEIKLGDKVLPYPPGVEPPSFIAYLMDAAGPLEKRIETLVAQFWNAAMWEFSDRPKERTATEVTQEWAAGVGAFLTQLAGAMEEAENEEKMLLAQADNPDVSTSEVGTTKFAREYKIQDVIAELTRLKELVFGIGDRLPMSAALKAAVGEYFLTRLDEQAGILQAVDEDTDVGEEIRAATEEAELQASQLSGLREEADRQPGFPEEDETEEAA